MDNPADCFVAIKLWTPVEEGVRYKYISKAEHPVSGQVTYYIIPPKESKLIKGMVTIEVLFSP